MNFLATFVMISVFIERLGYQQVGEKQDMSTLWQPASSRMKTDHGQTQGNCVLTSAGTKSVPQGHQSVLLVHKDSDKFHC